MRVFNRTGTFRVGFGLGVLKIRRASIGPDAEAKSTLPVSDRTFTIAGIKQTENPATCVAMLHRCDCSLVKFIFFLIKTSLKFKIMFLISGLNSVQTG